MVRTIVAQKGGEKKPVMYIPKKTIYTVIIVDTLLATEILSNPGGTMTKKSMKSALSSSLLAEDEAVRNRFEKAESLLQDKSSFVANQATDKQQLPEDTLP